jgi:hypothetical protein
MNLTRFSPQLKQAFFQLVEQPAMLARIGGLWFLLALAAQVAGLAAKDNAGVTLAASLLDGLAFGAFGYAWQRFIALGETASLNLDLRVLAWAFAYQLLVIAEAAPMPLFLQLMEGSPNAVPVAQAGQQVFQILIGGLFLLLPHLALYRGEGRPSLVEMVMTGGLAVGLGYVLAGLPFLMAQHLWKDVVVSLPDSLAAQALAAAVQQVLSFAALAVAGAYFALVWKELRQIRAEG